MQRSQQTGRQRWSSYTPTPQIWTQVHRDDTSSRGDEEIYYRPLDPSWHTSKRNKGHLGLVFLTPEKATKVRPQMNGLRPGNVCNFSCRTLSSNVLWATALFRLTSENRLKGLLFPTLKLCKGRDLKKTRFSYVNCSLSYGRTHQRATNLRVIHTQSAKFSIARTLWFEVGYPAFTNTIPALRMVFSLWRHFT